MRLAKNGVCTSERKPASALSSKLIDAMQQRIIPMATDIASLPALTRFVFTPGDVIDDLIKDIKRDNPCILLNRDSFLVEMQLAYDRHSSIRDTQAA
jgi:hypothetical protein